MKKITIILLFINSIAFCQIDNIKQNTLYIDFKPRIEIFIDSINNINGYPRQGALTYINYSYDSVLNKQTLILNKVTEKYLSKVVLSSFEFPTIKIPLDSLAGSIKVKLEDEIISNDWNVYLKNNNLFIFNYNRLADDNFTQNQRNYILSKGGKLWNFN